MLRASGSALAAKSCSSTFWLSFLAALWTGVSPAFKQHTQPIHPELSGIQSHRASLSHLVHHVRICLGLQEHSGNLSVATVCGQVQRALSMLHLNLNYSHNGCCMHLGLFVCVFGTIPHRCLYHLASPVQCVGKDVTLRSSQSHHDSMSLWKAPPGRIE